MSERVQNWPVYVINLAGSDARLAAAGAALRAEGIDFLRFEAVDGRALGADEVSRVYDAKANRRRFRHPLVGGEIGCYLSHIAIWKEIVDNDIPGAVILEDDFAVTGPLADVLAALAKDSGDWDMVKLYTRRPGAKVLRRAALCEGVELAEPYQIPNTTLGYVLRKPAAERLLKCALPFSRPIDEDHKRFWEHGLSIWQVLPPVLGFGVEALDSGSIAAARQNKRRASLKQGLVNLRYRLKYLVALHYHRLFRPGR